MKIDELNQTSKLIQRCTRNRKFLFLKAKNKSVIRRIEIIKEAKNFRFWFKKKAYERKRHCFNGEQQKVIKMKGTVILVKVDEM